MLSLSHVKCDILFSRERTSERSIFQSWYRTLGLFSDQNIQIRIHWWSDVTNTSNVRKIVTKEFYTILCVGCVCLPESSPVPFSLETTIRGRSSWKRTKTFSQGYSLASVFYCRDPAGARVFCEDFCCRVVTDRLLFAFYSTESPASNSPRDTDRTNLSKKEKYVNRKGNWFTYRTRTGTRNNTYVHTQDV